MFNMFKQVSCYCDSGQFSDPLSQVSSLAVSRLHAKLNYPAADNSFIFSVQTSEWHRSAHITFNKTNTFLTVLNFVFV